MIQLTPVESRLLGVLIEKALTTPNNYPLSLNALQDGANQKNNRDPVVTWDEAACFEAVEALRGKGLAMRVDTAGGRVSKYRHAAAETWELRPPELSVLAELLLRGPQTLGELRGRASRMHPLESLEIVKTLLTNLMTRQEPMVRELPPLPGSRAERYAQLLCPDAAVSEAGAAPFAQSASHESAATRASSLGERVEKLEAEVTALRAAVSKLATAMGEADPFGANT